MSLERTSHCKVNLLLNILRRRPDGFHELETVMQPVNLCDTLVIDRGGPGIALTCSDARLPVDATNLVHRAATGFLEAAGIHEGVRIHLEKRIPMEAGLGGGSGNAGATLLGLNELFGAPLEAARLTAIAASLGSDVPFFLQDGPGVGTGRGEVVTPLAPFAALRGLSILLIHPGFGVPTAWAYKALANHPQALNGRPGRAEELIRLLNSDSISAAAGAFYNSLEAPVLHKYPILQLFQEFLRDHGAEAALMSGSGSTTFALVRGQERAESLKAEFLQKFGKNNWTAAIQL